METNRTEENSLGDVGLRATRDEGNRRDEITERNVRADHVSIGETFPRESTLSLVGICDRVGGDRAKLRAVLFFLLFFFFFFFSRPRGKESRFL